MKALKIGIVSLIAMFFGLIVCANRGMALGTTGGGQTPIVHKASPRIAMAIAM
jgi:hypothetical protein